MNAQSNIELLLSDARGIYIPRDFVSENDPAQWGIDADDEDWETCHNPDDEWYWEAWASICDKAQYTKDGKVWALHQDGDLFAVAWDELTDEEYKDFTGEARDDAIDDDLLPAMHYLTECAGQSWKDAKENVDDVCLYNGSLIDAATEQFDEIYTVPDSIAGYIDYEKFARDCELGGDMLEFEYNGKTYTCTNNNDF